MAKRIHREEGFTLIELMIVILIIGILVGIAVPVFLAARGSADEKACLANQRSFLSASDIFAAETGWYPTEATHLAGDVKGPSGDNSGAWPADYYEGTLTANAPTCPGGGTVTMTYGETDERPSSDCDDHGSPTD
jgi:type II secretion system protein G